MDSTTPKQHFLTPAGFGQAEFDEKRSRFIGYIWHVTCEAAARELIADTSKQHADAAHNAYAYIAADATRYSDDGEPTGTAGVPVLNVLKKEDLHDALCIVTRYYGGIRLGAGGLVRAYSQAAKMAIDAAGIVAIASWRELHISCNYGHYDRISKLIAETKAVLDATNFTDEVSMTVFVLSDAADAFAARITDITAGSATVSLRGYKQMPAPV